MLALQELTTQIQGYLNLATPWELLEGKEWYANAKIDCLMLSHLHGVPTNTVAGMVAALSPRNRWSRNVVDAESVILHGECATVATFKTNKAKAVRILQGEWPLDVLSGNKVRAFYTCIVDPLTDDVCVDGHAYGVACGYGQRVQVKRITDTEYTKISQAYQCVASANELAPHQVQAITWLVYRRIHNIH